MLWPCNKDGKKCAAYFMFVLLMKLWFVESERNILTLLIKLRLNSLYTLLKEAAYASKIKKRDKILRLNLYFILSNAIRILIASNMRISIWDMWLAQKETVISDVILFWLRMWRHSKSKNRIVGLFNSILRVCLLVCRLLFPWPHGFDWKLIVCNRKRKVYCWCCLFSVSDLIATLAKCKFYWLFTLSLLTIHFFAWICTWVK